MDTVRRLLALLLVLICGWCITVWAGWFNENLDFLGHGFMYARKFPLGPDVGPIAIALGALMVAYFVYPAQKESGHHRR